MNSFGDKLQDVLGPMAAKLAKNPYLVSIRDGMMAYMPFTFIASIFLIIAHFPVQGYLDFMTGIFGPYWRARLGFVAQSSLDIGGLLVVVSIAYSMAKHFKVNQIQSVLTAIVAFMVITPQDTLEGGRFLQLTRISAQAIFLSILVGILTVKIYQWISDKGLKFKMPDSVPPAVSAPFESIIPSFIVITCFWLIRVGMTMAGTDLLTLVTSIIGRPLTLLGGSLIGTIIVILVEQLLWFFGLHGWAIVGAVMEPIWLVLEDQNRIASYAGYIPENIISMSFRMFSGIGIIGAVLAILVVAKSRQYKEVGKIASVPYIFNIGEPTLFGIPLMLNMIYIIPFLFSRVISTVLAYAAFATGIVPMTTGLAQVPWTTPPIISGFLVTGSIMGSLLQLLLLVVSALVWIPFVKIADKQLHEKEKSEEAAKKPLSDLNQAKKISTT